MPEDYLCVILSCRCTDLFSILLARTFPYRPDEMQLRICRITDIDDLEYLAPVEFAAFVQDACHNVMLGWNEPASIKARIERQKKDFTSTPSNFWIKVFDADADNRIIAASNWKIFPTYVKSEFEAKAKHLDAMTAKDVSFTGDEQRQEDAIVALKGFVSMTQPRISSFDHCTSFLEPL